MLLKAFKKAKEILSFKRLQGFNWIGNPAFQNKVCFIKTDTLYIGGNLYKVYPFLWNRRYLNLTTMRVIQVDRRGPTGGH